MLKKFCSKSKKICYQTYRSRNICLLNLIELESSLIVELAYITKYKSLDLKTYMYIFIYIFHLPYCLLISKPGHINTCRITICVLDHM